MLGGPIDGCREIGVGRKEVGDLESRLDLERRHESNNPNRQSDRHSDPAPASEELNECTDSRDSVGNSPMAGLDRSFLRSRPVVAPPGEHRRHNQEGEKHDDKGGNADGRHDSCQRHGESTNDGDDHQGDPIGHAGCPLHRVRTNELLDAEQDAGSDLTEDHIRPTECDRRPETELENRFCAGGHVRQERCDRRRRRKEQSREDSCHASRVGALGRQPVLNLDLANPADSVDEEVHAETDRRNRHHEREEHRPHLEAEQCGRAVVRDRGRAQACRDDDRRPVGAVDNGDQEDDEGDREEDVRCRVSGTFRECEFGIDGNPDRLRIYGALLEAGLDVAQPGLGRRVVCERSTIEDDLRGEGRRRPYSAIRTDGVGRLLGEAVPHSSERRVLRKYRSKRLFDVGIGGPLETPGDGVVDDVDDREDAGDRCPGLRIEPVDQMSLVQR